MDVRSYLASTRFAVIVTAVVVAIPVNYLLFELTGNGSLAFLGMFTLGVSVPQAYSQSWPAEYDRLRGAGWAVGACAVTLAVFLAAYAVATLAVGGLGAAIAAFLAVQLSLSAVSSSLESDEPDADGLDGGEAPDDAT
jgi:hypothetical protein